LVLAVKNARKNDLWHELAATLRLTEASPHRDTILTALGGSQDRTLLKQFVADSVGAGDHNKRLPLQDWGVLFAGIAGNAHYPGLCWEFFAAHFNAVRDAWGSSQFQMKAIITSAVSSLRGTAASFDKVKAFFAAPEHNCPVAVGTVARLLERLQASSVRDKAAVDEILHELSGH